MSNPFTKAARQSAKLKLAITGPSGSGKTTAALRCARGLVGESGKIAVIDTENRSASLYSDITDFDVLNLETPLKHSKFAEAIQAADSNSYDCVIIDSASHLWEAILEYKAKLDKRPGGNSYTNWNEAGSKFKEVIACLLGANLHVISCLRSKMEYILQENAKGKMAPQKVGMAPIMRDGIEYEFTVVLDLEMDHLAKSSKDRTRMFDGETLEITEEIGEQLSKWLEGAEVAATPKIDQPTNSQTETNPNRGKEARAKIDQAWKALGKTDADIPAACKFADGKEYSSFNGLSVAGLEKLLKELQRQMNVQAGKTQGQLDKEKAAKSEKPSTEEVTFEEVPMVDAKDLEAKLPKGSQATINAYLAKLGWIKAGETYEHLPIEKIEKILAKFDNFLRVAGVSQEAA